MDIIRILARWSGFTGAPGFSAFHFAGGGGLVSDAQQVADRVRDAFDGIRDNLPSGVRVQIEPEAEVLDSDTGMLQGYREVESAPVLGNGGTGGWSAASGAVVNWRTGDLRNGRRIRGRTFIVPLAGGSYATDGTLSDMVRANLQEFGAAMVGGDFDSEFGVWSRPINGSGGVFATATGYSVPDMAAVLRSRRD